MKKLLLILAIAIPMLGLYDLAHANGENNGPEFGGEQEQFQVQFQHQRASAAAAAASVNEGNNSELGVMLNQDIDLTENSLVTVAPALSANGVDCNMESRSYSIILWSFGKSKCEKGSVIWRDYARMSQVAGPAAAMAVLCTYKPFRKVAHLAVMASGEVGVDCRELRKQPPLVHAHTER